MQPSEKKVLVLLGLLSEQSGEKVSTARLEFIAESLCELGADAALVALKKLLESARRFPTVAEVKAVMGLGEPTARDLGNEIASVMLTTMSRIGVPVSAKGVEARDVMLGPAALFVVEKMGGWAMVVEQAGENTATFRAQVRDLAESYAKQGYITAADVPKKVPSYGELIAPKNAPALPGSETGVVITKDNTPF